jgi:uncharacterized protein
MSSAELQSTLDTMVRRIVDRFAPERVILFGSHARGTADAESDIDLLVVMQVEGSKRSARLSVRKAIGDIAIGKDVLVYTPEEVHQYQDIAGHILRPALREGRVLYDRHA